MNHRLFVLYCMAIAVCLLIAGTGSAGDPEVTFKKNDGGNMREAAVPGNYVTAISGDTAPPLFPMCFYGSVTINGEPAPDGTVITAEIDGAVRGQDISFVTTLRLTGDIYDLYNPLNSAAIVLLSYTAPGGLDTTVDVYPVSLAEYSSETPDLRINNNTVTLTEKGYHVHVESADNLTVFDAIFEPLTEPAPLFIVQFTEQPYEPDRLVNWLVASPKMKVDGTLTTGKGTALEMIYMLENSRGYHDHNWGYWLWQDDIGWDWGQASETCLDGYDEGKYAFCFGNVTDNQHTESRGTVLNIWENKTIISTFEDNEIQIRHYGMTALPGLENNSFPAYTVLSASDSGNSIGITFNTEQITPLPIPVENNRFLVIWELTGTYSVSGFIDGELISYTSKGFMEYVS